MIVVRDDGGILMAALYDGDDNRTFTAERTEDINDNQFFAKKRRFSKAGTQREEGTFFWYGWSKLYPML